MYICHSVIALALALGLGLHSAAQARDAAPEASAPPATAQPEALTPQLEAAAHAAVTAAVRQALPAAQRAAAQVHLQLGAARGAARQTCAQHWDVAPVSVTQLQRLHVGVRCGTQRGSLVARVQVTAAAWATQHALPAAHTLQAHDIAAPVATLTTLDVLWPHEALAGMTLRTATPAGTLLRPRDIERPLLLRRGDPVEIRAQASDGAGAVAVAVAGIATGNGRLGETVTVRNARTQRPVQGRVVAAGVVEAATQPLPQAGGVTVWEAVRD